MREAAATWRHDLARPATCPRWPAPRRAGGPRRAGVGSRPLVVPARLDRHGPAAARAHPRVLLAAVATSRTASCSTSWARSSGWTARPATTRGWASLVHTLIEECENGRIERPEPGAGGRARTAVAPAGVPVDGGLRGVPRPGARCACCRRGTSLRRGPRRWRRRSSSSSSSTARTVDRLHRPDRVRSNAAARRSPTTRPARSDNAGPRPRTASSWASTTSRCRRPRTWPEFRPVRQVGARLPARQLDATATSTSASSGAHGDSDEEYQSAMRERLAGLIAEHDAGLGREVYRPNPARTAASATSRPSVRCSREGRPVFPPHCVRRDGRPPERPRGTDAARRPAGDRGRDGRPTPRPEQWRAISMPLEPYVLVAGAGSGKTSVMAARVVYLALVGAGPHRRRPPGRAARQRAVPDLHEQGHGEPAACASGTRSPRVELAEGEEPRSSTTTGSPRRSSTATACWPASSRVSACCPRRSAPSCARASWTR